MLQAATPGSPQQHLPQANEQHAALYSGAAEAEEDADGQALLRHLSLLPGAARRASLGNRPRQEDADWAWGEDPVSDATGLVSVLYDMPMEELACRNGMSCWLSCSHAVMHHVQVIRQWLSRAWRAALRVALHVWEFQLRICSAAERPLHFVKLQIAAGPGVHAL